MNQFEFHIQQVFETGVTNIWVIERAPDGEFNIVSEKGELIRQKLERGVILAGDGRYPFVSLPYYLADGFLRNISEHLSKKGIKSKDENHIEGELQAKKEHLADMQMIVKKVLKLD